MTIPWLIASIVILSFSIGAFLGAPWVPAFRRDLDELFDLAGVSQGTRFVDLGCGDGKVLVAAARRGATVTGYEINPLLWLIAWLRLLPYRKRAKVFLRNYWLVDLGQFDVVYFYLIDHYLPKMRRKLTRELKPDGMAISYMFVVPGVQPTHTTHNSFLYAASAFDTMEG